MKYTGSLIPSLAGEGAEANKESHNNMTETVTMTMTVTETASMRVTVTETLTVILTGDSDNWSDRVAFTVKVKETVTMTVKSILTETVLNSDIDRENYSYRDSDWFPSIVKNICQFLQNYQLATS